MPPLQETVAAILESKVQPIKAVMPAGSCVFYRGSVVYGGGANQSARPRLGCILEYAAGWLRLVLLLSFFWVVFILPR